MDYNITIFHNLLLRTTGCIINVMDLKNFPNAIVPLKVDRFEGFSNQ